MHWKLMTLALTLTFTSACTVKHTKTEFTLYRDGEVCAEGCTEETTIDSSFGSLTGKAEIMGNKLEFEADTGEKIECTPKNNTALPDLIRALQACSCGEEGDDGAGGGTGDTSVAEVEEVEPIEGECTERREVVTECSTKLSESDWDCKEL